MFGLSTIWFLCLIESSPLPPVAIVPLEESDIDVKLNGKYKRAIEQGLKDIKAGKTTTLKSFVQKHLR